MSLVPGVSKFSRSQSFAKKQLYKKQKSTKVTAKASNEVTSKFYPADDVAYPKVTRKTSRPATLRASITPGTVLILLAGRFQGKRVVFLRQLESGLLLVTGPHKVNGVPLRRVNQAYVIATSAKLDISSVKVDAKINDAYFKSKTESKKKATAQELFGENAPKKVVDPARALDQKTVDAQLMTLIKKTNLMKGYLGASFALSKGQYPHSLKF